MSERKIQSRIREGRLAEKRSQRMRRAGRVFERVVSLFNGDRERARRWLKSPRPALGGKTPLHLARTESGAREVNDLIGRIEHGIVS